MSTHTLRNTISNAHWFSAKRTNVSQWSRETQDKLMSLVEPHETLPDASDHDFWHRVTTELNATTKHSKLRLFPGEVCKIMKEMMMRGDNAETLQQTVRRALSEPPPPTFCVSAITGSSSRSSSIDEEVSLWDSPRSAQLVRATTRSPIKRTLEDPVEGAPSKRLAHLGSAPCISNMKRASSSPAIYSQFLVGM